MQNRALFVRALCCTIFVLSGAVHAANDSLYFLYQRTTYLENLYTPGGWWANPALVGEITSHTVSTMNVTPLGDRYTLASVKYQFPFFGNFGAGIGIMGTGIAPDQSTQFDSGGVNLHSHFTFSNPSFQLGIGGRLPAVGSAGFLFDIGAEMLPDGYGGSSNFLVARGGLGILTPFYFNAVSLSLTGMATMHFWDHLYMDENGKIGLRFKILDDLVLGAAEYTFSFRTASVESFYPSSQFIYEVFKATVSVRIYKIAGLIAGYSTDFGQFSGFGFGNGNCLHAGIELRPQDTYPFFGGYDLGLSTSYRDLFIHRIWLGFRFLKHPKPESNK
jgi:hypothetical protein